MGDERLDYVIWKASTKIANACVLGDMRGFDAIYHLMSGVSFIESFPPGVEFGMSPDYPDNIVLTDNLINSESLIVGSARLRRFLESRDTSFLEYLPVSIRNHKGRVASKDYFVVNPIVPVDCLDEDASEAEASSIIPGEIEMVQRLVLDPQRVDPAREIFRIARFPEITVVQRKLAEAIDKENFTGIRWLDISEYPEI